MGEFIFSRMIRDARAVSDRPPTTEKPFEGGESGDNSKHLFSQVQHHVVTSWRTMNGNDELYNSSWATEKMVRLRNP